MASVAKRAKQDFSQTLYEHLKCHICESRLRAGKHRWYRCTQAHMICQDCREVKGKTNCSCTEFIPLEFCKVIEALLNQDKMQFKCENLARGCQESSDEENMIFHQIECIYRTVNCPDPVCRSQEPFYELLDHMKTKKKCRAKIELFGAKNDCSVTVRGYRAPVQITVDKKVFFSFVWILDGVLHHWIQIYGSPSEAKNYSYTLEYYNDTKTPKVTNTFSDQVVSIDETADSITENGNCFSISRKVLENKFIQEQDTANFKFSVKIRNLKEEVKDENVESGVSDVDE